MGIRLFVGGDNYSVQGERHILAGDRCFTAAIPLKSTQPLEGITAVLDSGAFSDPANRRLTPAQALERQFAWERRVRVACDAPEWAARMFVTYDRLIDETWVEGVRYKKRWTYQSAVQAVDETVSAAAYMAGQRNLLENRRIVFAAQGVEADQYADCARSVLSYASPEDWFGFGGWCIIGMFKRMMPEFERTIRLVLPLVADAGLRHVHIFGVMWRPALGRLLWLADQYGISVSTDSSKPIKDMTYNNPKKSGARCDYWRDNVEWWRTALATIRTEPDFYREPGGRESTLRQLDLFGEL